jgi:hypothetical protein
MNKTNLLITCAALKLAVCVPSAYALAPLETCNPVKVASAASGYMCHAGSTVWQVRSEHGQPIYYDTLNEILVTGVVATLETFESTQRACPTGYHVPSAGILNRDGDWDASNNQAGEFGILNADGFRDVIPTLTGNWFWSSSRDSFSTINPDVAFYFRGEDGGVRSSYSDGGNASAVICVSK